LCLAGSPARAQPPCPVPTSPPPVCPSVPSHPPMPGSMVPPDRTTLPGGMGQPGGTGAAGAEGGLTGTAETAFASLGSGAGVGSSVALAAPGGYIDNAIPKTMFRLRFDAAYDDNRPDRAEFFYAKCGCFRVAGVPGRAPGPPLQETSVD